MMNKSPIIKPRSRHYGSNFIYSYSHKLGKVVTLESNLEYWHFLQVELDPAIIRFEAHPDKITVLADDGKERGSIFDIRSSISDQEATKIHSLDNIETDFICR